MLRQRWRGKNRRVGVKAGADDAGGTVEAIDLPVASTANHVLSADGYRSQHGLRQLAPPDWFERCEVDAPHLAAWRQLGESGFDLCRALSGRLHFGAFLVTKLL